MFCAMLRASLINDSRAVWEVTQLRMLPPSYVCWLPSATHGFLSTIRSWFLSHTWQNPSEITQGIGKNAKGKYGRNDSSGGWAYLCSENPKTVDDLLMFTDITLW